jgi:hypothetical protein
MRYQASSAASVRDVTADAASAALVPQSPTDTAQHLPVPAPAPAPAVDALPTPQVSIPPVQKQVPTPPRSITPPPTPPTRTSVLSSQEDAKRLLASV